MKSFFRSVTKVISNADIMGPIVTGAIFVCAYFIIEFSGYKTISNWKTFFTSATVTAVLLAGKAFFSYLQPTVDSENRADVPKSASYSSRLNKLEDNIAYLKKTVAHFTPSELVDESGPPSIDHFIVERAKEVLSEDNLKLWLRDNLQQEALKKAQMLQLEDQFEDIGYRISGEINRTIRNANLNLLIGSFISFFGIALLVFDVFLKVRPPQSTAFDFFKDYLPRLTMVLFLEIFAFFFLRIYKSNQSDIKHFQNEKTNLDLRAVALKTAFFVGDQQMINQILRSFVNSERNSVLNTGQTTVELEKEKLDQLVNKGVSEKLAEIFKTMNGKTADKA